MSKVKSSDANFECVCVCVCVVPVLPMLWEPNKHIPTSIVIPVNFDLVGTFLWSPLGNKLINHTELSFLKI